MAIRFIVDDIHTFKKLILPYAHLAIKSEEALNYLYNYFIEKGEDIAYGETIPKLLEWQEYESVADAVKAIAYIEGKDVSQEDIECASNNFDDFESYLCEVYGSAWQIHMLSTGGVLVRRIYE